MRISELENEDALDLLADLIDPATAIFSDANIKHMFESKESKLTLIKYVIKNHKTSLVQILAALDGVPVEEYHANIIKMTTELLELLNNKDLADFFSSQGPKKGTK